MNELKLPIASITDEFSPDLTKAIPMMKEIGMTGAELRVIGGKNIMDLTEAELDETKALLTEAGISVISIASPLLKCVLPNGPEIDSRFQHDIFASKHTFEDQPRLTEHAFHIAKKMGAKIIRVFSYWRTVQPERTFDAVIEATQRMAEQAAKEGLLIGIENEPACNCGTAEETAHVLNAVQHPNLVLVWDPANALVAGEEPFPHGYSLLPKDRIAHVHAKDCHMEGMKPIWGPVATRHVKWKEQVAQLYADGYRGFLSLETHWAGPNGDNKIEASRICGWNLRGLAAM